MIIGSGTLLNVALILVGGLLGILLGDRLKDRTKATVTAVLGLFVIVLGGMSVADMGSQALADAAGPFAMIVILLSLVFGALFGSWLRIEDRLEGVAGWVRRRLTSDANGDGRFVDGMVTATLLFCVGPLSILGSISDGLGLGADQLYVKAVLDGFAAMAFASTFGKGVLFAAIPVAILQGAFTLVGFLAGDVFSDAQIDGLSAVGGLILIALGVRLVPLKPIPVGDLLPALVIAPVALAFLS
ncbi:DUF554 domain-containing protein [Pseudoclavibacter sp. RFBJ3]|uniref:DUF554 domain-containing protein n=1 Tax=unclassified Pseudoclavibacter TaxID=2615177 RepID=UPI000CE82AAE|nr:MULTISPECIES: DUF554 domain-containing protein [unclassified Pseudoclavibacter]PPF81464.1 DUF554 domain-containing protein [Pseudoclavibacter sp. RFBJ5]PPF90795.1 DUF554 domain-containing protein [Pseudoclavibacter sp. RFBJ3]PPG00071.1 DUF554 domain-containing protein [Pseudoclavibacter sp. RFBH5]PPG01398.1 DUF554 domain-containing protein [Pseudoclavibacter sp. RFBI5]PPG19928.1 DUF554 domain-containing protein [Pseudoclavibacter sp. RFBI4]